MTSPPIPAELQKQLYAQMVLIRRFEEKIVALCQKEGCLPGMQILAVGQEAVAVGIVAALATGDVIVSNHRSHGHLLARGADPAALMAEIMGKASGVGHGKAGTLHLSVPEVNALMTSTVVGAGPPMAAGAAFAQQYRATHDVTVVFFGDGAAAEGSVHEAMNLAGLWKLPLLFVCENNCWAGAQKPSQHCSTQDISKRGAAYGMPGAKVDGNEVEAVYRLARQMVAHCRSGQGPALIEAKTYRMRGHGERDHQHYVEPSEIEYWARLCPVAGYRQKLLEEAVLSEAQILDVERQAEASVEAAVAFAEESAYPLPESALTDVWTVPESTGKEAENA
jgi:TPP-dependent pyruvate/acetoin dehydrogenase alpha subunit